MAKANILNARLVETLTDPGRHADGGTLYLSITPTGSKRWVFFYTLNKKQREMGLGGYPTVSLKVAREKAALARVQLSQGIDPLAEKAKAAAAVAKEEAKAPTFKDCVDQFLASMEPSWRNDKHRAQWRMTLDVYAQPLHDKQPAEIQTEDVLKVLNPLWQKVPETASRLRGRIEMILDYAKAKGWRTGENVAAWRGHLKNVLPARKKLTRGHHAAMDYKDVPAFVKELQDADSIGAQALEFLIHTAARSGEVMGATWPEIDLEAAIWTIPASRMKAGKEHRVPITGRALEIVKRLHENHQSEYVFPGVKKGKPLSNMAMEMVMRRMKRDQFTVHGFRSAFRDWAGDATSFPREVAEQALAHRVGDATEQAYRRNDALEKRRKMMDAWTDHLQSKFLGKN